MKKIVGLLVIVFIVSLLFVPLVSADVVVINSFSPATTNSAVMHHVHPSASTLYSARGIPFEAQNAGYLTSVTVKMKTTGAPIGHLSLNITGVDGSLLPNATVYAVSSSVYEIDELTSSWAAYTFQFDGTVQLLEGKIYSMTFYVSEQTFMDYNNRVELQGNSGSGYPYTTNSFYSSAWHVGSAYGIYFIMYGDTVSGATPTPAPSVVPTSSGSDGGDVAMQTLTDALLPVLVPLLVMLIPAFLALKFVGPWGFFVGLNVGMIIAYVTLAGSAYAFPLWGVVAILIVDGLLVFGKMELRS